MQEPLSLTIRVTSFQPQLEKLRVNAVVNEFFLCSGSTLSILEVPPHGLATLTLSLLPLKSGLCPLPAIHVVWDRGTRDSLSIFDMGLGERYQQLVFVHPQA
jgi:hypothetical protein